MKCIQTVGGKKQGRGRKKQESLHCEAGKGANPNRNSQGRRKEEQFAGRSAGNKGKACVLCMPFSPMER